MAFGQTPPPQEKYKVLGISVENATQKTGTETSGIIGHAGIKIGDEITVPGDQVRQAINRLWALRIFSDVQILIDNKVDNGVYLLIKVKEYPRLDHVDIEGSDDVSQDDIMKKVTVVKGQVISPDETKKITNNIKKLYEGEGHLLAEIASSTAPADTTTGNSVVLKIKIDEGPSVSINKIHVAGGNVFSEDEIKDQFDDTKEKTWWHFWSHPQFDRKKFEADKDRVLKFYRKNGYIDAEIVSDSTWYSPDKRKIDVLLNVREGAEYKIRRIIWDGNTVYRSDILNERLAIAPGEVYNEEKFDQNLRGNPDQSDVGSLYLDNGYLQFRLDPEIKRVAPDSLDILVHVSERNQFRVRQVDIVGNKKTHDNVIRRELFTRPGDFFSRSSIIRSLRQLQQLNYFNPEKLKPEPRMVDDENVDIVYEVEEKSSDNVNASVGYSGAFGVTGSLGFTINNFSLSQPLTGGAGQVMSFDWQFGEGARFRTFSLGFTEPWLYDSPTTLGVSLYDTRQIFVYDLQQTGLSVRIGRGRLKWPDNYFRIDWTMRFQSNNVIDNGGNLLYQTGKTTQWSLTQTISRNSTDSPIFPSVGSNVSLSTEISGGPFLPGNVDYHKWLFSGEWYTPLFNTQKLVLYFGETFGYVNGFEDDSNIPPIEYFYMGGTGIGLVSTTSLRGYEDRSVGPLDRLSREIGGRVLTKHSAEVRLALTVNPIPIYILGFAEAGNVFSDFKTADFFDLKRSFGFGARLMIQPLGLIGFDYGYGADDVLPRDGQPDGWRFHFQFGRGF
ncbi:MAG TPA: outer membrane protein assembly factor BamA [Bacteroidota bacterium]|nr:outer membrane protein assembly factor BamA [Bacteroidota bacterium]